MTSEHTLKCPHCGHVIELDFCDGDGHLVTYWGEEDHDAWCSECDKFFKVREHVTRDFEVVEHEYNQP